MQEADAKKTGGSDIDDLLMRAERFGLPAAAFFEAQGYELGEEGLVEYAAALKEIEVRRDERLEESVRFAVCLSGKPRSEIEPLFREADFEGFDPVIFARRQVWNYDEAKLTAVKRALRASFESEREKRLDYIKRIQDGAGWLAGRIELELAIAHADSGITPYEFARLRLWEYSRDDRRAFISTEDFELLRMYYYDWGTANRVFTNKARFNKVFRGYVKRVSFINRRITLEQFLERIDGLESLFVKPLAGFGGTGVEQFRCNVGAQENEQLFEQIMAMRPSVVEETIVQHEDLAKLNASAVNTVRILTIVHEGKPLLLQASLRVAMGGIVDNIDSGGLALEVDLDSGVVVGNAVDQWGCVYETHPVTGARFEGVRIPFWEDVLEMACEVATAIPQVRLVGWDFAITPDGVELIEGNAAAGHQVGQLAHLGVAREGLRDVIVAPYLPNPDDDAQLERFANAIRPFDESANRASQHVRLRRTISKLSAWPVERVDWELAKAQRLGVSPVAYTHLKGWEMSREDLKALGCRLENGKGMGVKMAEPINRGSALDSLRQGSVTIAELCACMEVEVPDYMLDIAEERVTNLSGSLRNIKPGSAYFAVGGRNTYVNNVKAAFEKGAVCVVSRMHVFDDQGNELPCIVVDQPRFACAELAGIILAGKSATTIAITGSIGKTTTKEMMRLVAESEYVTQYSRSNENGFGQVVKYAQTLSPETQVYIQETGLSEPSSIDRAGTILRPDGFVITNIGWNHVGHFGGKQENILYEKMALDRRANHGAIGFINGDDPLLMAADYKHHIITFGVQNENVDYRAENIVSSNGKVYFDVYERGTGVRTPVVLNILGEHNALDAVCAFAVGRWLGIERGKIVEALAKFKPQGVRQNLVYLGGQHVYLDCYNASEGAINSVGDTMKTIDVPDGAKRVFVVGDIDDKLGARTEEVHRRVGRTLAAKPWIDLVICFGDHAHWIAEEASKAGTKVLETTDRAQLEKFIRENVMPEDLVAFKGGQQMQLSKTLDSLFGTPFYLLDHDVIDPISTFAEEGTEQYRIIEDYGAVLTKGGAEGNLVIPDQVEGVPVRVIGGAAFSRGKLKGVIIPEGVRTIGNSAFFSCYELLQAQLPSTLEHIGQSAFNSCINLESVVLREGVRTISRRAFAYCRALKTIVIPDSVKTIEEEAFFETGGVRVICSPDSYAARYVAEHYPNLEVSSSL